RAYLDGNRGKMRSKRANALDKIVAPREFRVLASDQKNLTKSLTRQMLSFGDDLIEIQGDAKNRIIARKTAILAVVDAFIGEIQRREQPHRASEILKS